MIFQTKGITKSIPLERLEIESQRGWRLIAVVQEMCPVFRMESVDAPYGGKMQQNNPTGGTSTVSYAIVEKDESSAVAELTKENERAVNALHEEANKSHQLDKELTKSREEVERQKSSIGNLNAELGRVQNRLQNGADALSAAEKKLARLREQLGKKQYDEALGDLAEKKS